MDHGIFTVDLHGYRAWEAVCYLEYLLETLPSSTTEMEIIHGYRSGTVLRQIVRQEFTHRRILSKISGWNPGETTWVLRS